MDFSEDKVVQRISQIRDSKHITKRYMAQKMGIDESNYGRLENGGTGLSYKQLVNIASIFGMSVIDVLTYPSVYDETPENGGADQMDPLEAILQIRLKKSKRDQVLNLIFGDNNLEILSK